MNQLGIPIQILNGVDSQETLTGHPLELDVKRALTNNAKAHIDLSNFIVDGGLQGGFDNALNGVDTLQGFNDAILKHLIETKKMIAQHPDAVAQIQNPIQMAQMFDYAIENWNTPNRDKALEILAEKEADLIDSGHIKIDSLNGYVGLDGVFSKLRKAVRTVGNSIKKVAKKIHTKAVNVHKKVAKAVKKVAKKAWEIVKKFNPLSVAVRNGFLLALRVNLFKIADKLAVGYLPKNEALKHGYSDADWNEANSKVKKVEKMHVNILGGQASALKKAILSGDRKWVGQLSGLNGYDDGLGIAATAAGTGAASGIIAKVVSWIKNLAPLAKKVVSKLKKDPRKAALQEQYGKKDGRRMYREEKQQANESDAMKQQAMAEYNSMIHSTSYTPTSTTQQLPLLNEVGANVQVSQTSPITAFNNQLPVTMASQNLQNTSPQPLTFGGKISKFVKENKKPIIIVGALLLAATVTGVALNQTKKRRKTQTAKNISNKKPALAGVTKVELS